MTIEDLIDLMRGYQDGNVAITIVIRAVRAWLAEVTS